MKKSEHPTNEQLLELDRRAAIDEAVGDCHSMALVISNELAREKWDVAGDPDVEILKLLSRQLLDQVGELIARTNY